MCLYMCSNLGKQYIVVLKHTMVMDELFQQNWVLGVLENTKVLSFDLSLALNQSQCSDC